MLILVGELMLLHEGDAKGNRFPLAWVLVWSGIAATMAANVTFGAQWGAVGAVIWGWCPRTRSFLSAAGMVLVRASSRRARATAPCAGPSGAALAPIFTDAETAAAVALRRSIEGGNRLSDNQLTTRFHLTRSGLTKVRQLVTAGMNGHAPPEAGEPAATEGN